MEHSLWVTTKRHLSSVDGNQDRSSLSSLRAGHIGVFYSLFKMADYNKKLEEPLSRGWGLPYSEVGTQACPLRRGAQRHTEAAEGWCPTDDWRGLGRPALSVLRFWHVMKILLFEFSPGLGLQNSVNCMSLGKTCRSSLKKPTLIPFLHEGGGAVIQYSFWSSAKLFSWSLNHHQSHGAN